MRVVIQLVFVFLLWAVVSSFVLWLHPDAQMVMRGGAPAPVLKDGEITLATALELMRTSDVLWVDVRPETEYRRGRVPASENVPSDQPGVLESKLFQWTQSGRLGPDTQVIVYCASPGCGTSHQLRNQLLEMNALLHVQVLAGGWPEWIRGQPDQIVAGP
jgi:rhodanese-related sulfurtransferase